MIDGSVHLLAGIASSVAWLFVNCILWVCSQESILKMTPFKCPLDVSRPLLLPLCYTLAAEEIVQVVILFPGSSSELLSLSPSDTK